MNKSENFRKNFQSNVNKHSKLNLFSGYVINIIFWIPMMFGPFKLDGKFISN